VGKENLRISTIDGTAAYGILRARSIIDKKS